MREVKVGDVVPFKQWYGREVLYLKVNELFDSESYGPAMQGWAYSGSECYVKDYIGMYAIPLDRVVEGKPKRRRTRKGVKK